VPWGSPGKSSTSITTSSTGGYCCSSFKSSAAVEGSSTTRNCYRCLRADAVSLRRWGIIIIVTHLSSSRGFSYCSA